MSSPPVMERENPLILMSREAGLLEAVHDVTGAGQRTRVGVGRAIPGGQDAGDGAESVGCVLGVLPLDLERGDLVGQIALALVVRGEAMIGESSGHARAAMGELDQEKRGGPFSTSCPWAPFSRDRGLKKETGA